jgi:hypothetical protein
MLLLSLYDHSPFTHILLSDASNLAVACLCLAYAGMLLYLAWRVEFLRGSSLALALLAALFGSAFALGVVVQDVDIQDFRAWLRLLFICFVIGHIGFIVYHVATVRDIRDIVHDFNNGGGRSRLGAGKAGKSGAYVGDNVQ